MSLLDEVKNFYDEYNGFGESPKPFDLDDFEIRKRGRLFNERSRKREQLKKEYLKAADKYKEGK